MKQRKGDRAILTKRPMRVTSIRLDPELTNLWQLAADMEAISQSDFLRRALCERAQRILGGKS